MGKSGSTFASRALRNDRTRNLNLSSSVCRIMSLKLVFGSIEPVCSSIISIYGANNERLLLRNPGVIEIHTCFAILARTLSINSSGHGNSSGAMRSATHDRVRD